MSTPRLCSILFWLCCVIPVLGTKPNYIMYLTGQHNVVPEPALISQVTHVALAFMQSGIFNNPEQNEWPLFTTVEEVRSKFSEGTAVMIAIGGWGDTEGFSKAAKTEEGRRRFARKVAEMVERTGADGVDVDWEYPGGNGEDYKTHPNAEKTWQITAYPQLLAEIRAAIGPEKIISAAVPGLPRDMLAFTPSTIPSIMQSVDFLNVMTYDLMNRRDNVTKHHTGVQASREAITAYVECGAPAEKLNLGYAFYVKWFRTAEGVDCAKQPVGCATELLEDPGTGADLGKTGGFSWHDEVPSESATSFARAMERGMYDGVGGGHYYWDEEERLFWSWDTSFAMERKTELLWGERALGGVFAWGLGEDAPKFEHLETLNDVVRGLTKGALNGKDPERNEL